MRQIKIANRLVLEALGKSMSLQSIGTREEISQIETMLHDQLQEIRSLRMSQMETETNDVDQILLSSLSLATDTRQLRGMQVCIDSLDVHISS